MKTTTLNSLRLQQQHQQQQQQDYPSQSPPIYHISSKAFIESQVRNHQLASSSSAAASSHSSTKQQILVSGSTALEIEAYLAFYQTIVRGQTHAGRAHAIGNHAALTPKDVRNMTKHGSATTVSISLPYSATATPTTVSQKLIQRSKRQQQQHPRSSRQIQPLLWNDNLNAEEENIMFQSIEEKHVVQPISHRSSHHTSKAAFLPVSNMTAIVRSSAHSTHSPTKTHFTVPLTAQTQHSSFLIPSQFSETTRQTNVVTTTQVPIQVNSPKPQEEEKRQTDIEPVIAVETVVPTAHIIASSKPEISGAAPVISTPPPTSTPPIAVRTSSPPTSPPLPSPSPTSSSSSTSTNTNTAFLAYKQAKVEARQRAQDDRDREEVEKKRKANEDLARRMRLEQERNETKRLADAEAMRITALEQRNKQAKQAEIQEKRKQELYQHHYAATAAAAASPETVESSSSIEVMSSVDPLLRACKKGDIISFTQLLSKMWLQIHREEKMKEESEQRELVRQEKERKERVAKEIKEVLEEAAEKKKRLEEGVAGGGEEDDAEAEERLTAAALAARTSSPHSSASSKHSPPQQQHHSRVTSSHSNRSRSHRSSLGGNSDVMSDYQLADDSSSSTDSRATGAASPKQIHPSLINASPNSSFRAPPTPTTTTRHSIIHTSSSKYDTNSNKDPAAVQAEAYEMIKRVMTSAPPLSVMPQQLHHSPKASIVISSPPSVVASSLVTPPPVTSTSSPSELETVRRMLIYLDRKDINSRTILQHTIWRKHTNLIPALLQFGANPNTQDSFGNTALHLTCQRGLDESAIMVLLQHGARLDRTNSKGKLTYELQNTHSGGAAGVELKEIIRVATSVLKCVRAVGEKYSEGEIEALEAYVNRKTLQFLEQENEKRRNDAAKSNEVAPSSPPTTLSVADGSTSPLQQPSKTPRHRATNSSTPTTNTTALLRRSPVETQPGLSRRASVDPRPDFARRTSTMTKSKRGSQEIPESNAASLASASTAVTTAPQNAEPQQSEQATEIVSS